MYKIIFAAIIIFLVSCSTFHPFAKDTIVVQEDSYLKVSNAKAHLSSLTYGDFSFATNKKAFKKLNNGYKPLCKNILFYAKTIDPSYDYYVLYNTPCIDYDSSHFDRKDIAIDGKKFVVLISKLAPQDDKNFIYNNISYD